MQILLFGTHSTEFERWRSDFARLGWRIAGIKKQVMFSMSARSDSEKSQMLKFSTLALQVDIPGRRQLLATDGGQIQDEEEDAAVAAHSRDRPMIRDLRRCGDANGAHGSRMRLVGRGQPEAGRV